MGELIDGGRQTDIHIQALWGIFFVIKSRAESAGHCHAVIAVRLIEKSCRFNAPFAGNSIVVVPCLFDAIVLSTVNHTLVQRDAEMIVCLYRSRT